MDIGILTYYGVHNHGALLQAYALKCVLENMGHKVRFLSFERSYEYISSKQVQKYKISLKSIPFFLKYTKEKGIGNIVYNLKKRKALINFRKERFDLGTEWNEFYGDLIVIGSDEVFSLEIGYNPMLYGHGLNSKSTISYAASFGPTIFEDLSKRGKKEEILRGLNSFNAVSVRDKNSQEIVEALCEKEVPMVCDPVILYGYQKELEKVKSSQEKYILIYSYDSRMNDTEEVNQIIKYARKYKMKIYSVGFFHKWCDRNINASPIELLEWVKNAKLVITDTFHGSVMSIICNTPMAVKLRDNSNKLEYLLKEYGLGYRIINSFEEMEKVVAVEINFDDVNVQILNKRKESMYYLKTAIFKHAGIKNDRY